MKTSVEGLEFIKDFEGCKLEAYQDVVGVWTIGYGSTGAHVTPGLVITQPEAEELLVQDLVRFERGVARLITVPLAQKQFDALVSFAFNLGNGALQRSTLRMKVNREEHWDAAGEFNRWVYAGGRKLRGLVRRRQAEAMMYLEGALCL